MSKCIDIKYLDVPNQCPKDKCYIYVLLDPDTEEIRYVGKTWSKITVRLNSHCCISESKEKLNYRSLNWIKSLKSKNKKPLCKIIDVVNRCDWENSEKYYISYFKNNNFNLTNTTDGGESGSKVGIKWSEITREKNLNSRLKRNNHLNLIDLNGNIIIEDSNYFFISKFLNCKPIDLSRLGVDKYVIQKKYFITKNIENISKFIVKKTHSRILIKDINSNFIKIFENSKEASQFIGMSTGSISIALNKNKIIKNYKIERYYGEMY